MKAEKSVVKAVGSKGTVLKWSYVEAASYITLCYGLKFECRCEQPL